MKLMYLCTQPKLVVTTIFTLFICAIKYPFDYFWARFDVYYHATHSKAYIDGFDITYPTFTFFSKYPADPWFLYHWFIGGIYYIGNVFSDISAETATIAAHIILAAVLCYVLLWFFESLFIFMHGANTQIAYAWYIALPLVYMLAFPNFTYRAFFFERPHVLMISLTLVAMIAVLKKRYGLLFLVSLLAPLTYSFAFFIFIPLIVFVIGHLLVRRSLRTSPDMDKIIFFTFGGFITGIVLHPDSIGYLINGLGFHTFAIVQSILIGLPAQVSRLIIPDEMRLLQMSLPLFYSLLGAALLIALDTNRKAVQRSRQQGEDEQYKTIIFTGLLIVSQILLVASIFISRTSEYAMPFAVTVFFVALPFWAREVKRFTAASIQDVDSTVGEFLRSTVKAYKYLTSKTWLKLVHLSALIFMVATAISYGYLPATEEVAANNKSYQAAAEYISMTATESEVILQANFFIYPQLLKTNPVLRYSVGMDPRMVFFYNPELSYAYAAVFKTGECYTDCPYTPVEGIAKLREQYEINYIILDEEFLEEQNTETFADQENFDLVFTDAVDDRIKVYRIK